MRQSVPRQGSDVDPPGVGRMFHRVVEHVEDHLFRQRRIGENGRQIRRRREIGAPPHSWLCRAYRPAAAPRGCPACAHRRSAGSQRRRASGRRKPYRGGVKKRFPRCWCGPARGREAAPGQGGVEIEFFEGPCAVRNGTGNPPSRQHGPAADPRFGFRPAMCPDGSGDHIHPGPSKVLPKPGAEKDLQRRPPLALGCRRKRIRIPGRRGSADIIPA